MRAALFKRNVVSLKIVSMMGMIDHSFYQMEKWKTSHRTVMDKPHNIQYITDEMDKSKRMIEYLKKEIAILLLKS